MSCIKYIVSKIEDKYQYTLMDIGAMGGIPEKWNKIVDDIKIIAFEPDKREFSKLKSSKNILYLNYALNNKSEDLKYYITKNPGKSSIFKPCMTTLSQYEDVERFQIIQEETLPAAYVKNIDSIIQDNSIEDVDFVKIDTQGSELFILQGGQRELIPKVFGFQIEVEFIEMYEKQPFFRNVDEFMNANGFQLMDIRRHYWKRKDFYDYSGSGQLIFGDALYFKKTDVLKRELTGIKDNSYTRSKILKCILTCIVYKMYDYAVSLLKTGLELGQLTDVEASEVFLEIKRYSSKETFLNFHLNPRLYNGLISLLEKFRPRSYLGWADSDKKIGNIRDI